MVLEFLIWLCATLYVVVIRECIVSLCVPLNILSFYTSGIFVVINYPDTQRLRSLHVSILNFPTFVLDIYFWASLIFLIGCDMRDSWKVVLNLLIMTNFLWAEAIFCSCLFFLKRCHSWKGDLVGSVCWHSFSHATFKCHFKAGQKGLLQEWYFLSFPRKEGLDQFLQNILLRRHWDDAIG